MINRAIRLQSVAIPAGEGFYTGQLELSGEIVWVTPNQYPNAEEAIVACEKRFSDQLTFILKG